MEIGFIRQINQKFFLLPLKILRACTDFEVQFSYPHIHLRVSHERNPFHTNGYLRQFALVRSEILDEEFLLVYRRWSQ